jgi:hypothetical protein
MPVPAETVSRLRPDRSMMVILTDRDDSGQRINLSGVRFKPQLPVKLGHDKDAPVVGTVTRVVRESDRFEAEFVWKQSAWAEQARRDFDAGMYGASIECYPLPLTRDRNSSYVEAALVYAVALVKRPSDSKCVPLYRYAEAKEATTMSRYNDTKDPYAKAKQGNPFWPDNVRREDYQVGQVNVRVAWQPVCRAPEDPKTQRGLIADHARREQARIRKYEEDLEAQRQEYVRTHPTVSYFPVQK